MGQRRYYSCDESIQYDAGKLNMQNYEALFILKAVGTEQDMLKVSQQVDEAIKKNGGTIHKSESMGRRRLAFRIERQAEGYYHFVRFTAPTQGIEPLKRNCRLDESIIRFMIVTEDEKEKKARANPPAKQGDESENAKTLESSESSARS